MDYTVYMMKSDEFNEVEGHLMTALDALIRFQYPDEPLDKESQFKFEQLVVKIRQFGAEIKPLTIQEI